jgi:hypothetical protein
MQPETPTETVKVKEQKKLTPVQEWDQVAFSLIYQELAPDGFKKIHNGKREVSTNQFLTKQTVKRCQNISAQLIRVFREGVRNEIQGLIKTREEILQQNQKFLRECRFYQFRKKRHYTLTISNLHTAIGTLQIALSYIDGVAVPRKQKADQA